MPRITFIVSLVNSHAVKRGGNRPSQTEHDSHLRFRIATKCSNTSSELLEDWFGLVWFMVLNATFNNILVISRRSVLLVEETGENHRPNASH